MIWSRVGRPSLVTATLCTVTATVAAALAGCGSSSSSLAAGDATRLHRDVAGIRSAAARRNPQAATAAVKTLQSDVARLQTTGRLAPADAAVLLTDARQTDRRVALEVHAPAPRTPAAPAPAAPATGPVAPAGPPPPGHGGKDHGKHKGDHGPGGGGNGGGD